MGFEPTTSCLGSKHSSAELHPPNHIYFSPKIHSCKGGVFASSKIATELSSLISGHSLLFQTEGNNPNTTVEDIIILTHFPDSPKPPRKVITTVGLMASNGQYCWQKSTICV